MNKVIPLHPVKVYATEEEATDNLPAAHLNNVYCPIIQAVCRRDCICYEPPIVETTKTNSVVRYVIQSGFCSNAMFTGEGGDYA